MFIPLLDAWGVLLRRLLLYPTPCSVSSRPPGPSWGFGARPMKCVVGGVGRPKAWLQLPAAEGPSGAPTVWSKSTG